MKPSDAALPAPIPSVVNPEAVRVCGAPPLRYREPAKVFVTGFIGSLKLNLFHSILVPDRRGGATLQFGPKELPLSAGRSRNGRGSVATLYDKREFIYKGTIDVASIGIWLRKPADQDPRETP